MDVCKDGASITSIRAICFIYVETEFSTELPCLPFYRRAFLIRVLPKMKHKARLWRSMDQNTVHLYRALLCLHSPQHTLTFKAWKHQALLAISQAARVHQTLCCISEPWLSPWPLSSYLSLCRSMGQQLNSMDLPKDLVLPLFFQLKFKGSGTWTFVMICADLRKKTGLLTYLRWQCTSKRELIWLFSVSLDSPLIWKRSKVW